MNVLAVVLAVGLTSLPGTAKAALVDNFDPLNPAVTPSQNGSAPAPAVLPADAGSTGQFLRLVNDATGGQDNGYAYDRTDIGRFANIVADLDFRATAAGWAADGFSLVLLDTATHGTTGAGPGFTAEEPNVSNSLGIGFDLHPADTGENHVSVHYNAAGLANVNANPVDLDAGVFHHANVNVNSTPFGSTVSVILTPDINGTPGAPVTVHNNVAFNSTAYENRVQFRGRTGGRWFDGDLDNINVQYNNPIVQTANTTQDFDNFSADYETDFVVVQQSGTYTPTLMTGGPTGDFVRLLNDGVNSQENRLVFDQAQDGAMPPAIANRVRGSFDFRAFSPADQTADGFSIILLPTATYGTTGDGASGFAAEEPNIPNTFAMGFDMYPAGVNDVSAHWNNSEIANVTLNTAGITLDDGNWHRAEFLLEEVASGANITLTLTPDVYGTPGTPVVGLNAVFISGLSIYENRLQISGRTGGLNFGLDLDNISVETVPEPSTFALAALGLLGLLACGRRKRLRIYDS